MLDGLHPRAELGGLASRRRKSEEFRSVPHPALDQLVTEGWLLVQKNVRTARLKRAKPKHRLFEDRVWTLAHKLGFSYLSGNEGATISTNSGGGGTKQIDVVAVDDDVACAIECKTAEAPNSRRDVAAWVDQLAANREHFARDVKERVPIDHKRLNLLILALWDIRIGERELERAAAQRVLLLDERQLTYFEQLADHLGPASRYQFLASIAPNSRVDGLKIRVPALRSRTAGRTSYTFSIRADYLLKIAYVSHRAAGGAEDVDTYQRMIKRARLKRLREFISEGGLFPTNVVLSIDRGRGTRFERQREGGSEEGATWGFLTLSPSFGSAWVIDGQHRLFAYSGHELAASSYLNVVAYENLAPSEQAQMFIEINHEQKSVKRTLLQELYAELKWDSEDEAERVSAVLSKAIQSLNEAGESPLRGRVLLADDKRSHLRCISLNGLFTALSAPGIYVVKAGVAYGPLWASGNTEMMRRTVAVVSGWLSAVVAPVQDWWELGSDEGGGLAMNDGVAVLVGLFRVCCAHLSEKGVPVATLDPDELLEELAPFSSATGKHLASLDLAGRATFRRGARGVQGQTAQRRRLEASIKESIDDFNPPGLQDFLEAQEQGRTEEAYKLIASIERTLKDHVIGTLKAEFANGDKPDAWWYTGVKTPVRKAARDRQEEDGGGREVEDYLDLIHLRTIASDNWGIFKESLAWGSQNKTEGTKWIATVNEVRKGVMHPASEVEIALEKLDELRDYEAWLTRQCGGE